MFARPQYRYTLKRQFSDRPEAGDLTIATGNSIAELTEKATGSGTFYVARRQTDSEGRPLNVRPKVVKRIGRSNPPSGFIPCKAVKITRNRGVVEVRVRR